MDVPVIFILLAVIFAAANLALWVFVFLGAKKAEQETGEKKDSELLLESSIKEMVDMFRDVEDMVSEIKEGNKQLAGEKPEIPSGLNESIDKNSKDIEKLSGTIDKLKSSVDTGSAQMDKLKNLMEDLDCSLVKLSSTEDDKDKDG